MDQSMNEIDVQLLFALGVPQHRPPLTFLFELSRDRLWIQLGQHDWWRLGSRGRCRSSGRGSGTAGGRRRESISLGCDAAESNQLVRVVGPALLNSLAGLSTSILA